MIIYQLKSSLNMNARKRTQKSDWTCCFKHDLGKQMSKFCFYCNVYCVFVQNKTKKKFLEYFIIIISKLKNNDLTYEYLGRLMTRV